MKRHNEPQKIDLTPSNGELDQLRRDMEAKKQIRMNGRLQSRFHQVMLDRNILKLDQWGDHIMRNPYEYAKMQKASEMIEAADRKAEDSLFEAHPELAAEAKERFQKFLKETREAVFGVSRNMKLTNEEKTI